LQDLDGPEKKYAVYEKLLLVPHFEGEEDDRREMTNLPATDGPLAPNIFSVVKNFDPNGCALRTMRKRVAEISLCFSNPLVGCAKVFEGAKIHHDEWVVPFLFLSRFEPFLDGRSHVDMENIHRGCGLTLEDVSHLLRPPGYVFEWKDFLLIAIVDACHMWLMRQVMCLFGMAYLCRFEGECWNERFRGTNTTQGPKLAVPIWRVKIRSFGCFGIFFAARFC
jgi:hypothetical protein